MRFGVAWIIFNFGRDGEVGLRAECPGIGRVLSVGPGGIMAVCTAGPDPMISTCTCSCDVLFSMLLLLVVFLMCWCWF